MEQADQTVTPSPTGTRRVSRRCVHCRSEIDERAKICAVCGNSQLRFLRVSQGTLGLLVGLVAVLGFVIPVVMDAFAPQESVVTGHYGYGDENTQHVFVRNEGSKHALLRSTAVLLLGGQWETVRVGVTLDVSEDPVLIPNESRVLTLQRSQLSYEVGSVYRSGEEMEHYDLVSSEWDGWFPGFGAQWTDDWCFAFRIGIRDRAALLSDYADALRGLRWERDWDVAYESNYARLLDVVDMTEWGDEYDRQIGSLWGWEEGLDEALREFVDAAKIMPRLTRCLSDGGVVLRLSVMGSNGVETPLDLEVDYQKAHRFLLPIWLADEELDPEFVEYFYAPIKAADEAIANMPPRTAR